MIRSSIDLACVGSCRKLLRRPTVRHILSVIGAGQLYHYFVIAFLPVCIYTYSQYIVSYQDNHIIINWLLPYLFITMNRWDHLDHFSQNLTFLLQSTLSKKSTFCFCRSRIPWTAPMHNSFVLWRCMWKELAPLDQPSTKCRKMIFQEKVKF